LGPIRRGYTPAMDQFDVILAVVPMGEADTVAAQLRSTSGTGATVWSGHGDSASSTATMLGIPLHPKQDLLLGLVPRADADAAFDALVEAVQPDRPGVGLVCMFEAKRVAGLPLPS
jgi:hypothetical protein